MKKEYTIYDNKKVSVEEELVNEHEKTFHLPFTDKTAEYLCKTSGCNKNDTEETLQRGLIEGIKEELEVMKIAPIAIQSYKDGIINKNKKTIKLDF